MQGQVHEFMSFVTLFVTAVKGIKYVVLLKLKHKSVLEVSIIIHHRAQNNRLPIP